MAQVGSSGFLGRVNNEEDLFKRKKNTVDNSVTPGATKNANKAKIASPKVTRIGGVNNGSNNESVSVEAYATNDINTANNTLNEAMKKNGLIEGTRK